LLDATLTVTTLRRRHGRCEEVREEGCSQEGRQEGCPEEGRPEEGCPEEGCCQEGAGQEGRPEEGRCQEGAGQAHADRGEKGLPRTEVVKKLWAYIKKHGLQDQKNKRQINADDKLKKVFGGKSSVSMFDMTKLVSKHLS
jgi:hypothetical protein